MKLPVLLSALFCLATLSRAQEVDPALSIIKQRLDSVTGFTVHMQMEVDIEHVSMPKKKAALTYRKGEAVNIRSDDFVLIPKKGLDFGLGELYEYPFMTLSLGQVRYQNRPCELIKVIPTSDDSDYSIATLWLDLQARRPLKSQISTKKNGVFDIIYGYAGPQDILPSSLRVEFLVADIRIPLRFLGREAQVEKDRLKANPDQKGAITLWFTDYQIARLP